jgi:hypothetical protein
LFVSLSNLIAFVFVTDLLLYTLCIGVITVVFLCRNPAFILLQGKRLGVQSFLILECKSNVEYLVTTCIENLVNCMHCSLLITCNS